MTGRNTTITIKIDVTGSPACPGCGGTLAPYAVQVHGGVLVCWDCRVPENGQWWTIIEALEHPELARHWKVRHGLLVWVPDLPAGVVRDALGALSQVDVLGRDFGGRHRANPQTYRGLLSDAARRTAAQLPEGGNKAPGRLVDRVV